MYNFNYHQAKSVDEASKLVTGVEEGKIMAGGMTLIPTLKQRLAKPSDLVDLGKIADLKGISILACGIGSLTQALGGDRAGAEAATQQILAETRRVKIADMLTANPTDVEKRVKEGFLALLMQGPTADDADDWHAAQRRLAQDDGAAPPADQRARRGQPGAVFGDRAHGVRRGLAHRRRALI